MNSKLRQQAVVLRIEKQLSYSEIKKRLNVPKSTLSYWLRELPLSEERLKELEKNRVKKAEIGREKYIRTMIKKKKEMDDQVYEEFKSKLINLPDVALFVAGLMLYQSEGAKTKTSTIVLANTDPRLIKFFIVWLDKFLSIPKQLIRVQLHLYENMNLKKEEKFWQDILDLPSDQFYKPSIRKLKSSSFSYKDSNRHGTCSLYAFGVSPRRKLMMAIKAFLDIYLVDSEKNKSKIKTNMRV